MYVTYLGYFLISTKYNSDCFHFNYSFVTGNITSNNWNKG